MWRWLRGIVIFGGPNERRIVKRRIEIGILYSRSGNYRLISESCRAGAIAAIADVNADQRSPIELIAVERDPQGNIDRYASGCEDILRNSGARHIIGCVTCPRKSRWHAVVCMSL